MAQERSLGNHKLPFAQFRAKYTALEDGITSMEETAARQQATIRKLTMEKAVLSKKIAGQTSELRRSRARSLAETQSLELRINEYEAVIKNFKERCYNQDEVEYLKLAIDEAADREANLSRQLERVIEQAANKEASLRAQLTQAINDAAGREAALRAQLEDPSLRSDREDKLEAVLGRTHARLERTEERLRSLRNVMLSLKQKHEKKIAAIMAAASAEDKEHDDVKQIGSALAR